MAHSDHETLLPEDRIDAVTEPLKRFLHIEAASGVMLLIATVAALLLANSSLAEGFLGFWSKKLSFGFGSFQMNYSLHHWINDGLMAIFFFVVGLEVKREIVMGELRDLRKAALPLAAAVGGMVVPAAVYLLFQHSGEAPRGWGIPMATDIAFVVGIVAVMGSRIPAGLRIMLLSLAIADDIGAILVIAIGYTDEINLVALFASFGGIALILAMMNLGIRNLALYLLMMALVWLGFHESGVHATIAGVIFGLLTPTEAWISQSRLGEITQRTSAFLGGGEHGQGEAEHSRYEMLREMEVAARKSISPLERFETTLHPWVGFLIMPVFALANAGVAIQISDFANPVAVAVMAGLIIGKPLGIFATSWIAVKTGIAQLPEGVNWLSVIGGGFLCGIGFTMAIFIAGLALEGDMLEAAKVGILGASFLCAVFGVVLLWISLPKPTES